MEQNKGFKISQYACAVLLIVSSIALVAYQVVHIDDVAAGLCQLDKHRNGAEPNDDLTMMCIRVRTS